MEQQIPSNNTKAGCFETTTHPPQEQWENVNTPDTEWEKKMIIYDHHIAKINRDNEGNIQSIVVDIPPVLKDILSSRDTYWKERVRAGFKDHYFDSLEKDKDILMLHVYTLLDNLK